MNFPGIELRLGPTQPEILKIHDSFDPTQPEILKIHDSFDGNGRPQNKEWKKPRNKNFVNACSTSTVQALYSLTCSKHIRGKSLRIQEADAAEATAVSVGL